LIYLDTSVLVAYYCPEPLSEQADRLVRSEIMPAVSDLTEVELLSALSRKVREGEMDRADAERVATLFSSHLGMQMYTRVPLRRPHYRLARDWIGRFVLPLRSLDALHLAVAEVEGRSMATADDRMARSAAALGIETILVTETPDPISAR
jgi:hypothetical protein